MKLQISSNGDSVVWADEEDEGATVGQFNGTPELLEKQLKEAIKDEDQEEVEYLTVEKAAMQFFKVADSDVVVQDNLGYKFSNEKLLSKFLGVLKLALKFAQDNKALPEWAETALSEGWKPPRGWKP